jgi:hypothetical protein
MIALCLKWLGGRPAFRIYGRATGESEWRVIDVAATARRNTATGWPMIGGTCITWSSETIAVGWDFAEWVLREQMASPASRDRPLRVAGGRLRDGPRRRDADAPSFPLASEVLAHECGHTGQARRFGPFYLIIGAAFTWWREGRHWWNWFENQASETGEFGGIVSGSVHPALWTAVHPASNEDARS